MPKTPFIDKLDAQEDLQLLGHAVVVFTWSEWLSKMLKGKKLKSEQSADLLAYGYGQILNPLRKSSESCYKVSL